MHVALVWGVSIPRSQEVRIRRRHAPLTLSSSILTLAFLAAAWPISPAAAQSSKATVPPTDSLTGVLESRSSDAFVVTSDDGGAILFEIAPDTLDTRTQMVPDSVDTMVPHAGIMDRRDILFVLQQLQESDERDRVHVHYLTVGETEPARRIAIWLSVERSRLPGG